MNCITKIPKKNRDHWLSNLPAVIKTNDKYIAACIAAWRYDIGLKPIKILIVRES